MTEYFDLIRKDINKLDIENIFFHTDILRAFRIKFNSEQELLESHCELIKRFDKNIIMPVFNYDFPKSGVFDVENDPCQVGVLNHYFRKHHASWQTPVPIFSCAGNGNYPGETSGTEIEVFGQDYIFGYIHRSPSLIMYYGADFSATTYLHYVETLSGLLSYRYTKIFEGMVIHQNHRKNVKLNMHVRPMGVKLNYDWKRLEHDLLEQGLLHRIKEKGIFISFIRTDLMFDFWTERLKLDALYFLDGETRSWVEPKLHKLGRPFELADFE